MKREIGLIGEAEAARAIAPAALKSVSILLVDDRPENLLALEATLEDLGHRLVRAASGAEALRAVLREDFVLILMDVQMPGMDGIETARLLKQRERSRDIPVIFLTANNQQDSQIFEGYEAGAIDYLFKPFNPVMLRSKVKTFVDLYLKNALVQQQSEQLREANRLLVDADRYKDEFLSVISHELRTPLNFITGFASTLGDEVQGPLNQRQHDAINKILTGADRMLLLVNDLLDFAKLQAGKLLLEPAATPYGPLIEDVLASLRPLADRKGLTLETMVEVPVVPSLDPLRVTQVLTNLVANAIKFTPEGGVVRVVAQMRQSLLYTAVVDTGRGIPETDFPKLFLRFKQLDMSNTREAGGTGLGLAICKELIEAHGGTLGVESQMDAGSTFWFTLPFPLPESLGPGIQA